MDGTMELSAEDMVKLLLEGWEQSLQLQDSLLMLAQEFPDWKQRLERYKTDPHRIQYSQERFSLLRNAFEAILQGEEAVPALKQAIEQLDKPPN